MLTTEANRKSQKLAPLENIVETHGGVLIHVDTRRCQTIFIVNRLFMNNKSHILYFLDLFLFVVTLSFSLFVDQGFKSSLSWPRCYKTFFMLNSAEHEILNAHKYENIKFSIFQSQISLECYFPAHKCENANNRWRFNIYELEKLLAQLS